MAYFKVLFIAALTASLTGCGKSLEDLVRINRPALGTIIPFEGQSSVKVSPGNTISTSPNAAMKVHVTVTNRPMTGASVAARVSISQQSQKAVAP